MCRKKSWFKNLKLGPVFVSLLLYLGPVLAGDAGIIRGREAVDYIGSLEEKAGSGKYSSFLLLRRNPHPRTDAAVDALVLAPGGALFRQVRHADSEHKLVINSQKGNGSAGLFSAETLPSYLKIITDNKLKPVVLIDRYGREMCIIYCAFTPCNVVWTKKKNGEIVLMIREYLFPRPLPRVFPSLIPDPAP